MFGSLKLGKPFGIGLYVHGTFWLLPLFVFLSGVGDLSAAAFDVAAVFAVFGCVALHEFGHALAASAYGIRTRDITLYPVGGVASLERMPEKPWHEIVVALAGPAVNFVIALGLFAGVVFGNVVVPGSFSLGHLDVLDRFVIQLLAANVFLLVFNLLPAFPMDGGRVLRAVLSAVLPRRRATEWAVAVGTVMAVGFVLLALLTGSLSLALVAVVVFVLGRAELAQVRAIEARQEWERRYGDVFVGPAEEEPAGDDAPFTGWRWDPFRRVWTQFINGTAVREVHVS